MRLTIVTVMSRWVSMLAAMAALAGCSHGPAPAVEGVATPAAVSFKEEDQARINQQKQHERELIEHDNALRRLRQGQQVEMEIIKQDLVRERLRSHTHPEAAPRIRDGGLSRVNCELQRRYLQERYGLVAGQECLVRW